LPSRLLTHYFNLGVTGKLEGDCSDRLKIDNDAEGTKEEETCFVVETNGIPQGTMGTMRVS
jgi:hypothetical protein